MGTGWRRARSAFGFGVCASVPPDLEEGETAADLVAGGTRFESRSAPRFQSTGNNAASPRILQFQSVASPKMKSRVDSPRLGVQTPRSQCQVSPRLHQTESLSPAESISNCVHPPSPRSPSLFRSGIRIPKSSCAICLDAMKPGQGHAIFTAECSHSFHFQCIASNVRHGNLICPVCRSKWKEVPWQAPAKEDFKVASVIRNESLVPRRQEALRNAEDEQRRLDPVLRILDDSIASFRGHRQSFSQEPTVYDDDEPLDSNSRSRDGQTKGQEGFEGDSEGPSDTAAKMEISLHPEVEAVAAGKGCENFTVLVHVKASEQVFVENSSSRAPLDLVTVLDVSGSMSGTKLSLLRRAMAFVISNLSPADRLAVVVFSSTAKRVFPLKRMVPEGQRAARRVIERLLCTGGTNISEGLRKGAKVLEDRRVRNPVASIMLLSDGHDTYSLSSRGGSERRGNAASIQSAVVRIPVHTFGFGIDHDAATMHAISEQSGGTFSFIQTEALVQEAFAQCIGGLLSVVVQDVNLTLSACTATKLKCLHAGSYETSISDDGGHGTVKLRDLYAEECRDILVELQLSSIYNCSNPTNLVSVNCSYKDPVSQESLQIPDKILSILRPENTDPVAPNLDVQKQQNRVRTAQAIAEAKTLADRGEMSAAQTILQNAKTQLQKCAAVTRTADRSLYLSLESEITEIQARMMNKQIYERSGRAFVLSSHSSHLGQRATTRGESFENYSREYQTPSMADMVVRSQTLAQAETISPPNSNSSSSASAWRTAEKLAKVAMMRKSCTKVSDLHGFENGGF